MWFRRDPLAGIREVVRTLIRLHAERAASDSRLRRRIAVLEAQAQELHCRLVAIEDVPTLTCQINAGEAISEAARG